MKNKYELALKYYTETKNEEQLQIAYKEIEFFNSICELFMWYYHFDLTSIDNYIYEKLSEEEK